MTATKLHEDSFRVLLIRPPYTRLRGTGQAPYFPLGLGYLTALINQKDDMHAWILNCENPDIRHERLQIDMESVFSARSNAHQRMLEAVASETHPAWLEIREALNEIRPHAVGLSVLTPEAGPALRISRMIKAWNPDCCVIWGGVHPTFTLEDTLQNPEIDYVVTGEGENSFLQLLGFLKSLKIPDSIPGVYSPRNLPGSAAADCCSALLSDLDLLPPPARHDVLLPERYSPLSMGSIMHSRGCPWRCGFCSSKRFWQETVRFRSPERVVDEMQKISEDFGIRYFTFWDDAFTIDRELTERLCIEIIRRLPRISWRTATRIDLLDDAMILLLKRSGCIQLELGIETGSPRMSQIIRKDIDLDQAPAVIDRVNKKGIACGVFLMAGFPDETVRDLEDTLKFMTRIKPSEIVLNVFDPMPGSEQYERAVELGLLPKHPDFSNYRLWPDAHFVLNIKPDEFNRLIQKISGFVFTYNHSLEARRRRLIPEIQRLLRTDPALLLEKGFRFFRSRVIRRCPR